MEQIAEPEDWVRVGKYPTLQEAYDHGLVILAMGEACRVAEAETPGEFELQAEAVPAPRISGELDAYGEELALSTQIQPVRSEWAYHPAGWGWCGVWVAVLIAVFYWQGEDPSLVDRAAASSVGLIDRGEWWRPFTALFLHADLQHLVGNLAGGTIFAMLVSKVMGPLRAWLMILVCGTLGNFVTAWMHRTEDFTSLGASTAVFAALGILSGHGLAETFRDRAILPWARITAPVLAGVVLLGWLGSGNGTNTDVMGHVFGFGSGLVAGATFESVRDTRTGEA
jgi:rhomboid protease GluP